MRIGTIAAGLLLMGIGTFVVGLALMGLLPGTWFQLWLLVGDWWSNARIGGVLLLCGMLTTMSGLVVAGVTLGGARRRAALSRPAAVAIAAAEGAVWISFVGGVLLVVPAVFVVEALGSGHYTALKSDGRREFVLSQSIPWRPDWEEVTLYERDGWRVRPVWSDSFGWTDGQERDDAGLIPDSEISLTGDGGTLTLHYGDRSARVP